MAALVGGDLDDIALARKAGDRLVEAFDAEVGDLHEQGGGELRARAMRFAIELIDIEHQAAEHHGLEVDHGVSLLGGQLDVLCDQTTQTLPQIKGNTVKLYGVTSAERLSYLPDTPTLRESGLKDFEIVVWHGIYGPKGMAPEVVTKVNKAVQDALKDPDVIQKAGDLGAVIVPVDKQTPAALQAWLKLEIDKWAPLLKAANQYAD